MKEITLKKSTHFISVIFNIASIIAIIVDIGAVLLLGGTLLSQLTLPGYFAYQNRSLHLLRILQNVSI